MPKVDDKDKLIEKLNSEKEELEDKCKSLAEIIEVSSTVPEPEKKQDTEELEKRIKSHIDTLNEGLKQLEKKVEATSQKPVPSQAPDLTPIMSKIDEKLQSLNNLPVLEQKLKIIETKLSGIDEQRQTGSNMFGNFNSVDANAENQVIEKSSETMKDIKDKISKIETKIQEMEKLTVSLRNGLNPKTLEVLNQVSTNADSILNEIVPQKISGEVDKILSSFSSSLNPLSEEIKEIVEKTEHSNKEISFLSEEIDRIKRQNPETNVNKEMIELIKALTLRPPQPSRPATQ